MKKRRNSVYKLTLYGMLIAVLVVLAMVNIPQPAGLSITFNMIPVAIAAIAGGVEGGAVVGGAFGLISFLQCFGILGYSAMGAALVGVSPVLMFVQRFVSRLLVGILVAVIHGFLKKRAVRNFVRYSIAGFAAAFLNTLFFMSLLVLLFGSTEYMQTSMGGQGFLAFVISATGVNALVEMIVSTLVTGAVAMALDHSRLMNIKGA